MKRPQLGTIGLVIAILSLVVLSTGCVTIYNAPTTQAPGQPGPVPYTHLTLPTNHTV